MAFAIPRIQYKNVDTTGDTHTSTTIDDIADTSLIEVGMFVRGSGIPTGATVATIATNSVTISAAATTTVNDVTLAFGYEILFTYPPIEPNGEGFETKNVTSESLSGVQQTSVNYIEAKRELKFSFVSQTIYGFIDTFLKTHALLGEDFRYFEDQTSSTYLTYELDALKSRAKKIASTGVDVYVWEVPLTFRRAL